MKSKQTQKNSVFKTVFTKKSLTLAVAGTALAVASVLAPPHKSANASASKPVAPADSQQVFFVGNNWDGTVTVIRPDGDFGQIGQIDMVPDRHERM